MGRKKKCPEHVDHERWLVSYADFITLLFAFFVVMYATASINLGKYKILSDSLYGAFNGMPRVPEPIQIGIVSKSPNLNTNIVRKVKERMKKKIEIENFTNVSELVGGKTTEKDKKEKDEQKSKKQIVKKSTPASSKAKSKAKDANKSKSTASKAKDNKQSTAEKTKATKKKEKILMGKLMARIAKKMKQQFSNLINRDIIQIRHNNKYVAVELNNQFLYESGKYDLNKKAIHIVGRIVSVLEKYPSFPLVVEGHTAEGRHDSSTEYSDWQLSGLRSSSLVHILTDFSVAPNRITASSYGPHKPAYTNKTKKGRRSNQRTTILIKADPLNTDFLRILDKMPSLDYGKIYDSKNQ